LQNRLNLILAFLEQNNIINSNVTKVAGDASFRSYYRSRLNNGKSFIIMDAPPEFEDINPFCKIDEFLVKYNFSAPKIFAIDSKNGFLLLEDFGDISYSKTLVNLSGNAATKKEREIYTDAIDVLVKLHELPILPENLAFYNEELLMREVMLLVEWYLPYVAKKPMDEVAIADFKKLWGELFVGISKPSKLVLRDYHADNLMLISNRPGYQKVGLLDFQDAVIGSAAYDLVSLLEDARRDVNKKTEEIMLQYYLDNANCNSQNFLYDYKILSLQRNIKIIGIFARLAFRDKKQHYLNLLPRVFGHIDNRLKDNFLIEMKKFLSIFISK
jgi:aminoglycoside/choline kinase family phosphotransferase